MLLKRDAGGSVCGEKIHKNLWNNVKFLEILKNIIIY